MRPNRLVAVAAVAVAVAVGCSDSTAPEDLTLEDLVGTWVASAFRYQATANPAQQFDLVAQGGAFTLTVTANGTVTGSATLLGETETFTATITVANGIVTITDATEVDQFTITAYDGDTITMTDVSQNFDFTPTDGIDNEVPASLTIVATRQ